MPLGERSGGGGRLPEVRDDEVEAPPRDQHHRRVEDILTGRAAMHKGRRVSGHRSSQRVDQRDHRIGAANRGLAQLSHVELVDSAMLRDAFGGSPGDEAEPRFDSRQRRLDLEHRAHPGPVGHGHQHHLGAQARHEEGVR